MAITDVVGGLSECSAQGARLRCRDVVQVSQRRSEESVKRCKRQRCLGLDAAGTQHGQVVRRGDGVFEER